MSGGSSLYLPLPQSNSDSEEELHSGRENHVVSRPRQKVTVETHLESGPIKVNYKQLDDKDIERNFDGHSSSVSVVKPSAASSRLSTTRKIFFVLSILLCLVTLAVFLWALPCDLDPCPPAIAPNSAKSWEAPLQDLELHGPISVVPKPIGRGKNLVLLARNSSAHGPYSHIVLCLLGSSGSLAWTHMLAREPWDMDCTLLDTNNDGVLDCVIAGRKDLLKVIDPLSGLSIWEVNPTSTSPDVSRTLFPVLLPDITGDGVRDLLSVRMFADSALPCQLILVSGATGRVIGEPVQTASCAGVSGLVLEKDFSVSYTCLDSNNKNSEQTVGLLDLIRRSGTSLPPPWPPEEARDLPRSSEVQNGASHEARVVGWRLLLENRGRCSNDCLVVVVLKDKHNNTARNFSLEGAYAMTPVTLSFDKMSGFVLKFWQWHGRKGKRTSSATTPGSSASTSSAFTIDYREMRKRSASERMWVEVSERVVLITFNDTDFHVVNVSQQSVILKCQTPSSCQPSPRSLQRSLLIADLDEDGSRELLSFSSSYIGDFTNDQARLQARVRVVRLEAELPQLFETSPTI